LKRILPIMTMLLASLACQGIKSLTGDTLVYLFPGQGADFRQFRDLIFPEGYDTVHVSYPVPEKHETLHQYALRFVPLINRDAPYVLLGVSLGGMICTELADTLEPGTVILISSAKSCLELPGRYNFQKKLPLNRALPKGMIRAGARVLQGFVEPDRRYDRDTFADMLRKKDPLYLKRTVDMIVNWDRTSYNERIVHIHGNADHTIPVRNVHCDYLVEQGSHLMVLTRSSEISRIIGSILSPGSP
jgi:pimeloyl-ACP methyl ester carboxylesterase